ncbi:MAG: trehalase family glycosidase [Terracidiphilus sp.]|jgi:putative isomerase
MNSLESTAPTRRKFCAASLGTLATAVLRAWLPASGLAASAIENAQPLDRQSTIAFLERTFQSNDPAAIKLLKDVYIQCILGAIEAPDPPLEHRWISAGGGYHGQWLWDTTFVVDLLAILPGEEKLIREVFQNWWDFQRRWSQVKPEPMHGMVANFIAPFKKTGWVPGDQWQTFPAYSQIPVLAWGMERVYQRNRDIELVRQGLQPLEVFHEWYWRERDVTNCGLIAVGSYDGDVQHARDETYDSEVDLDGLKLTPHPGRKAGPENGNWYGDILIPGNTAYLLLGEASLARLADVAGDAEMASRRRKRYNAGVDAMRAHMWSQKHGCFLAVERDSLAQIESPTVGSFIALMAKVPTDAQAARMAEALASPAWATPLPVPTVARTNPNFLSSTFWRGDTWPAPVFQIATGLMSYGLASAANRIADSIVANAIKVGIWEHYDSISGAPLGVHGLPMSATIATLMIDGLTSRYQLRRTAR